MSFYQSPTRFSENDYAYQAPPAYQATPYTVTPVGNPPATRPVADSIERTVMVQALHNATELAMELSADLRLRGLDIYDKKVGQMLAHKDKERTPEHQELFTQYLTGQVHSIGRDFAIYQQITMVNIARMLELPLLQDNRS